MQSLRTDEHGRVQSIMYSSSSLPAKRQQQALDIGYSRKPTGNWYQFPIEGIARSTATGAEGRIS
jgi:hypothetical protein